MSEGASLCIYDLCVFRTSDTTWFRLHLHILKRTRVPSVLPGCKTRVIQETHSREGTVSIDVHRNTLLHTPPRLPQTHTKTPVRDTICNFNRTNWSFSFLNGLLRSPCINLKFKWRSSVSPHGSSFYSFHWITNIFRVSFFQHFIRSYNQRSDTLVSPRSHIFIAVHSVT